MHSGLSQQQSEDNGPNVQVGVRFMPRRDRRPISDVYLFHPTKPNVLLHDPLASQRDREFSFDFVLDENAGQDEVFETVGQRLVNHALDGKPASLFVYGQSKSGRNHTLVGSQGEEGFIKAAVDYAFKEVDKRRNTFHRNYALFLSLYQVYHDHVTDLIQPPVKANKKAGEHGLIRVASEARIIGERERRPGSNLGMDRFGLSGGPSTFFSSTLNAGLGGALVNPPSAPSPSPHSDLRKSASSLRLGAAAAAAASATDSLFSAFSPRVIEVMERPDGTAVLPNLGIRRIAGRDDAATVAALFKQAMTERAGRGGVAEMPDRAHTVCTFTIVQEGQEKGDHKTLSQLNIVLMAQSDTFEDASHYKENAALTQTAKDLAKIVIAINKRDMTYVSFKDSRLTHLLQSSLTVNANVAILGTINPSPDNFDESMQTLVYASECRHVAAEGALDPAEDKDHVIKKLVKEVADLRKEAQVLKDTHAKQLLLVSAFKGSDAASLLSSPSPVPSDSGGASGSGGPGNSGSSTSAQNGGGGVGRARSVRSSPSVHVNPTVGQTVELSRAVEVLEDEKNELLTRLKQERHNFARVQRHVREMELQHASDLASSRDAVQLLKNNLVAEQTRHAAETAAAEARHEARIKDMIEGQKKLLNDQFELMVKKTKDLERASKETQSAEHLQRESLDAADTARRRALHTLEEAHSRQLAQVQAQADSVLALAHAETERVIAAAAAAERSFHAREAALTRDITLVLEYAADLAGLLTMVDEGTYPVKQAGAVKSLQLPRVTVSQALPQETRGNLAALIKRARHLGAAGGKNERTLLSSGLVRVLAMSEDEAKESGLPNGAVTTITPLEMKGSRAGETARSYSGATTWRNSGVTSADSDDELANSADDHAFPSFGGGPASSDTVEYISKLEKELDRYKGLLAAEQKRCREMQIALSAQERVLAKAKSSLGSSGELLTSRSTMGGRSARPPTSGSGDGVSPRGPVTPRTAMSMRAAGF